MQKFLKFMHTVFLLMSFFLMFVGFYTVLSYYNKDLNILYIGISMLALGLIGFVIESIFIIIKLKKKK